MKFKKLVTKEEPIKGLTSYVIPTKVKDVVTISGSMLGGILYSDKENPKISSLVSAMLDKGTQKNSKYELSNKLESIGAEISFISSNRHINFTAHCLKSDLELVVELISEQLRSPIFPDDELDLLKKRMIGNLEISKDNTKKQSYINFIRKVYPKNHYNYKSTIEESIQSISLITEKDLKSFHEKTFGLGSLNIAAAGDISNIQFQDFIKKYFDSWNDQNINSLDSAIPANNRTQAIENKNIDDKTSSDVYIGQSVDVTEDSDDYRNLMMGIYILGGNFSARLMQSVRDEEGLTYGIGSTITGCGYGTTGHWYTWGTFSPNLVEKGIRSTLSVIDKWFTKGVTERELAAKKTTLNGSFQVSLDTTSGLIDKILTNAEKGRNISYLDNYTNKINVLNKDEINRAIKTYLDPKKFITSIAGTKI
jgi:zinc protease